MTAQPSGRSELSLRIMSGLVMAALAVLTAWFGGAIFAALWTTAAVIVAFEWQRIVHKGGATLAQYATGLAAFLAGAGAWVENWKLILIGYALVAPIALLLGGSHKRDTAEGVIYATALASAVILCRGTEFTGLAVILWLFAVVWGTDTCAYFSGRAIGGPKLWPSVSPKKTWSGAIGGLIGGAALGLLTLVLAGIPVRYPHVLLSLAFSAATQGGDLFESALKRRYGVKDAGSIIPGHGGVMDRLDGFIVAAALAAVVGVMRGGVAQVPAGVALW
jgi:phosphatidate cytidylyltransferase